MSLYHRFIQVQAYKHDGSFHRMWSHAFVVRDDEEYLVVVSNRARVIESDEHRWHTREKAAFIFSKKEWFNTIASFREDGLHFYVNLASPAIVDHNLIKFIDYDLDIKGFPNGYQKVLDINEEKLMKIYKISEKELSNIDITDSLIDKTTKLIVDN